MLTEIILTNLFFGSVVYHSQVNLSKNREIDFGYRKVINRVISNSGILEDLKSNDKPTKIRAINEVGDKKLSKAFPLLIEALNCDDDQIRGMAAISLGKLENPEAISPLMKALKDKNHAIRGSAALSLGRIKATEAVDELIKCLKDSHFSVRLSACYALGLIGSTKAIKPIIELLGDDMPQVRENAVWVLGLLKAKEALPYIEFLTQDTDENVRNSARKAMFNIKYDLLTDISNVKYSGGKGENADDAIKITGISNAFACLRSKKEYLNKFYGDSITWEQVDQSHIKYNNKYIELVTVKEIPTGNCRQFYFDLTEFFSKF